MRTLSAEEYKKLYGEAGVTAFSAPAAPETKPLATVGGVLGNAWSTAANALTGQGDSKGKSAVERGIKATATAFGAVPSVATAALPDAIQKPVEQVGEAIGSGVKVFTDWLGSNPQLQQWTQDHPEATDRLMRALETSADLGTIGGTILGAKGTTAPIQKGITSSTAGVRGVVSKTKDALSPTTEQIAGERAAKITKGFEEQNTRLKSADKSFTKNTIVRKGKDGAKTTITPIDTFAKHNVIPVIEKGSIQMGDYQTGAGELGKLKAKVDDLDTQIDTKLVNSGVKVPIETLKQKAIDNALKSDDFRQSGTVSQNIARIEARFDDYARSYGNEIDVAEINNIRKTANKDYSPETQDVSRIVGDTARELVYATTPDGAVKALLQQQGELLAARKYAETINGTKVTGGRLGTMALRTTGAIIGTGVKDLPVVGPVAGMLGGEFAARAMQQSQFKSLWTELRALLAKEASQTDNVPAKPQK